MDASVLCKQFGLTHGTAFNQSNSLFDIAYFFVTDVRCNGSEHSLSDCDFSSFIEQAECPSGHVAGVVCANNSGKVICVFALCF